MIHLLLWIIGSWAFLYFSWWPWKLAGAIVSALGTLGVATNTHTSSHQATGTGRRANDVLTFFGYPFCLGLSATYWLADHVAGHHVAPNVLGIDDDFEGLPFFAITEEDVANGSPLMRWYYRNWQCFALFLLLPLFAFNLQRCGLQYLSRPRQHHPRIHFRKRLDVTCIAFHFAVFLLVPGLLFGPQALLLYVVRVSLMGIGLFALLAPAHLGGETPILTKDEFIELGHCAVQTMTTTNFDGGPIVRWLASGLDYQIEHHLFPEICHVYYPRISPAVREFCLQNGLAYRSRSFPVAIVQCIRTFRRPKPVGYMRGQLTGAGPNVKTRANRSSLAAGGS